MDEIKIQDGATEKRFTITKMSAYQAEQWLYRAAFALGRGVDDIQQVFSGDPSAVRFFLGGNRVFYVIGDDVRTVFGCFLNEYLIVRRYIQT